MGDGVGCFKNSELHASEACKRRLVSTGQGFTHSFNKQLRTYFGPGPVPITVIKHPYFPITYILIVERNIK